jgi:hypothetical protein
VWGVEVVVGTEKEEKPEIIMEKIDEKKNAYSRLG